MTDDPRWPRASGWLASGAAASPELVVLGVPAHETSISPTNAHRTPAAVRAALHRYSTYSLAHDVDVASIAVHDAGDVDRPDHPDGEARVAAHVRSLPAHELLIAVGGDNSITFSVMSALLPDLASAGLVTLDAHYDLREGVSNGSPVRRLIEASGRDIRLEVDGGIKIDNIRRVADAGADTFVAGSAIFGQPDYKAVIDAMRAQLR